MAVCTIGCSNQGKSTLTAAVTKVLFDAGCSNDVNLHQEKLSAFGIPTIEYQTNTRRYNHFDSPGNTDLLNISKISPPIGAGIVVVSAIDGPMKKTQELILQARELGVPSLVCFLSMVDLVDNPQLLQRMEDQLREFIYLGKYSCDESPIIQGSALHALQGVNAAFGRDSIVKLVGSLDKFSDLSQEVLHKNELAIAQSSESTAVLSQVKFEHDNQLAIPQSSSSTAIMSLVKGMNMQTIEGGKAIDLSNLQKANGPMNVIVMTDSQLVTFAAKLLEASNANAEKAARDVASEVTKEVSSNFSVVKEDLTVVKANSQAHMAETKTQGIIQKTGMTVVVLMMGAIGYMLYAVWGVLHKIWAAVVNNPVVNGAKKLCNTVMGWW